MGSPITSKSPPASRRRAGSLTLRGAAAIAAACAALMSAAASPAQAAAPTVTVTWATEVTASSARLRGLVDTGAQASTYRFDYLPLATYEANLKASQDPFKGALKVPTGFEAKLLATPSTQEAVQRAAGLSAETSYRYRLVAKNAAGEDIGPERTITTQEGSPSSSLPEGRGWELVSPVDKNGGEVAAPEALFGGGAFQAAAQGGAMSYSSASSFADAVGAPGASQYVSRRSASGWTTENVTLPTEAGAFGLYPDGVPYRLFSPDLGQALALTESSSYALLSLAGPPDALWDLSAQDLRFAGASSDLTHIVLSTCEALTPTATEIPGTDGCDPEATNLYEVSQAGLELINIEPGETTGTPGASVAAQGANAVSADGQRIYWVDETGALMLRDADRTLEVDPEGAFQAASADGATAFFTRSAHLYRYSLATESATDLTPGGGVAGVLGSSEDASHLYFQDASGLKLWNQGTTSEVAPGTEAADPSSFPPATGTARVSEDGTHLAFLSEVSLSGNDNGGFTELFLYDASSASLLCASCNPTGSRAMGPSSIPGALANGKALHAYKPRAMSQDAKRLFFESDDALLPRDSNGETDVYGWRAAGIGGCAKPTGCIGLISSGRGASGSFFIDASLDGADVFFTAPDSLVSSDPGSVDLYDARIGGGFPDPPTEIPCIGDACQPLPPEPEDPTPGTLFIGTEANPKLGFVREHKPRQRKRHRGERKHKAKKGHHKGRGGGR